MANYGRPELVIGVDFGMSQTGVAYCAAPWTNPSVFQKWSANTAASFDKAPTRLAYERGTRNVKSWGFDVEPGDDSVDIREYFKLHLDPNYQEYQEISHGEAKQWYRDYLACVHDHLARFFQTRYPQWATMRVEWNFSVPTTWKNAGLINDLQSLMQDAGFGRDGQQHSCVVTLTEAEAAAISAAQQHIRRDDVILVCDAGGGTTDVNIMKINSNAGESLRVEQLVEVEGREIGSALIDIHVQQDLAQRLQPIQHLLPGPAEQVAEKMMMGQFERFKIGFGTPGLNAPNLFLPVPGLPPGSDYRGPGIVNSRVKIEQEALKQLFDHQAAGMIKLIEQQLQRLRRRRPGERVSYLILSGGLSASEYIQSQLRSHFMTGNGAGIPNAPGMRILLAENLQLAVVKGLVSYRSQQIGRDITPIERRCAPVNYGIVVNQRYNQNLHFGQRVVRDKRDKKRWAIDQIEWLIRKGEGVTNEGVERRINAKLSSAQLRKPWRAQFVMSTREADDLPRSMAEQESVREICLVTISLDEVERVVRNHHWWNFGERYELAHFILKLVPGYADLRIQLISGKRLVNTEADRIQVEWHAGTRPHSLRSVDELDRPYV